MWVCMRTRLACVCIHVYMYIHVQGLLVHVYLWVWVVTVFCEYWCVCAHDYISASASVRACVCTCTCIRAHLYMCFCLCVCVWVVAPLVCGVCVERQRSLVPILYRLLISECVVAKCFLFLFSSRESIPWFLSVPRGRTRPPHMSRYLCVYTISYS